MDEPEESSRERPARTVGGLLSSLEQVVCSRLDDLEAGSRRRRLEISPAFAAPAPLPPGQRMIDLTHNDYLGLRADPEFQERVRAAVADLPVGSGGSRLLGGEHPVFTALEREFAHFKGAPDALYFPSGYAANEAVASALARLPDVAFHSDALNHASLIDGIRLGGLPKERRPVFRHRDLAHLEQLLAASTARFNVIFTESVFSMDGDVADLAGIARLARAYRGVLVVDEAHAILCLGQDGQGLAATSGLGSDELITVNTCGKALGAAGALVAGPTWIKEFLVNTARPFIYTTAPSPWTAAALRVALHMAPGLAQRRTRLTRLADAVRTELARYGYDTGASTTHILPLIVGADTAALRFSAALADRAIHVRAIRPPTVPEGTARLRLSLHAALADTDAQRLIDTFARLSQTSEVTGSKHHD